MAALPEVRIHRSITKALKLFDADRFRWLDEAAALGPLASLRLGPVKVWVVTDADVARTILVTDSTSWTRPPATLAPIRVAVGQNLFTQSDQAWGRVQPLIAPAFRRKALDARLAAMTAIIAEEVTAIPLDATIDLELAMCRVALRLAAWVLLGEHLDRGRAEEIAHHQREVVRWVGTQLGKLTGFIPAAPGARGRDMKRHRAVLNAYADEVVARARKTERDCDDVLGTLLAARPSGKPLSSLQLRGHVLGLFLAGNETTGAALSWALVHGARSPDEWRRIRDEPDRRTMSFLTETLRVTPAVWGIPRTPTKAGNTLTSHGITTRVRRGQLVTIYLRGINHDPTIWPDPSRFDPSRHDTETREQGRALLPFGLGPRGCIGQHLAWAELSAVLPALVDHGNVALEGTATEDPSFALRISPGLRGRFTTPADRQPNPPT